MKVLLDHCVPRRLREWLPAHEVHTAREMRWEQLKNGKLLTEAAAAGFDAFVTVDQNLKHQQSLAALPLPVLVLISPTNRLADLVALVPRLDQALAGTLTQSITALGPA